MKNPKNTKDQIAELTADLQRTRADFENFRKQTEIQKESAKTSAKLSTVYQILPLLDDIDRAINTYQELAPLQKSLQKTLKDLNLTKIDSTSGVEFNPELFEAVATEGDGERELVAETLRPGYFYDGSILRPALVKVKKTD